MRRIPIYQMTYGQSEDGKPGLVFTSEQEGYDSQSIYFGIPILEPINYWFDLIEYFDRHTFYFPFILGEKYFEIEAKVNFPELIFAIPNNDIKITFEIDRNKFGGWDFFPFIQRSYNDLKYVGKHNKLFPKNKGFLTLLPVDLYKMNELYNNNQGVFVGLTPNFGNFNENYGN